MKLTQIDLAEGRGGSQREVSASEAVARAEEACGGTLLLFEPDGAPRAVLTPENIRRDLSGRRIR